MILSEHGYEEAMLGLSLSYNTSIDRAKEVALKLAHKQGGHNNFLESIYVWLDIRMPRYWWVQMDSYRMKAQSSESTMHTLLKKELTQENFVEHIPETLLQHLNWLIEIKDLRRTKRMLPEGFLQRRIVCVSYKTLQNIVRQRETHKLEEWEAFIEVLREEIKYKEFIFGK
jgi:hypothetical protein